MPPTLPPILSYPQVVAVLGDDDGKTPTAQVSGDVLVRQSELFANLLAQDLAPASPRVRLPLGTRFAPEQWWAVLAHMHGVASLQPDATNLAWIHTLVDFLLPVAGEAGWPLRRLAYRCVDVVEDLSARAALTAFGAAFEQNNAELCAALGHHLYARRHDDTLMQVPAPWMATLLRQPSFRLHQQDARALALRWLLLACPEREARLAFVHAHELAGFFAGPWEGALATALRAALPTTVATEHFASQQLPYWRAPMAVEGLWPLRHRPPCAATVVGDALLTATDDGTLSWWEVASGRALARHTLAASSRVLTLHGDGDGCRVGFATTDAAGVLHCSVQALTPGWRVPLPQVRTGSRRTPRCAALVEGGLAVGLDDGSLWLLAPEEGKTRRLQGGHPTALQKCTSDGAHRILAASRDGLVAFDSASGRRLGRHRLRSAAVALLLAGDAAYVYDAIGLLWCWPLGAAERRWQQRPTSGFNDAPATAPDVAPTAGEENKPAAQSGSQVKGCAPAALLAPLPLSADLQLAATAEDLIVPLGSSIAVFRRDDGQSITSHQPAFPFASGQVCLHAAALVCLGQHRGQASALRLEPKLHVALPTSSVAAACANRQFERRCD